MEAKAIQEVERIENYKTQLMERISSYLAEDIENYMVGFDYMQEGIATGDSNLVIKGNVIIQRVLGRTPQFTNQEEFDEFMDSDVALKL